MSLKAFHLVFIIASIMLAAGFAAWSLMGYFQDHAGIWYLVAGIGSAFSAIALVIYQKYCLKKLKNISYL
jgi:hypothetical protein